jgi:hypothetical protein
MTEEQMKTTAKVCLAIAFVLIGEVVRYWLLGPDPMF